MKDKTTCMLNEPNVATSINISCESKEKEFVRTEAILSTAMRAGHLLLSSGAETYRVEETIAAILNLSGHSYSSFALMTGISASIEFPDRPPLTIVRRVDKRSLNLHTIHVVNQISRDLAGHKITIAEANAKLDDIDRTYHNQKVKNILTLFTAAGFSLLLSGQLLDGLASLINGFIIVLATTVATKSKMRPVFFNIFISLMVTIGARLIKEFILPGSNDEIVIPGTLMMLFPGTAITNAIRDTINGDYLSGGARAIEAFLVAASLALGTGLGIWITNGGIV